MDKLVLPAGDDARVAEKDLTLISDLMNLKAHRGFNFIIRSLKDDLAILEKAFKGTDFDLINLDPAKAISVLAVYEVNKESIRRLEGFINIVDDTIAQIRKKYENRDVDQQIGQTEIF